MDDWIEVFNVGRHTDNQGRMRDWTEQDLDHVAKSYNPAHHEAPNVIGHPVDNAPACGLVEAVKREGQKLLVKLKQVPQAFQDKVRTGLFKKRPVSFYPDGTLRHVGWLEAQPPAVKGLKDASFQAGEDFTEYEYAEGGHPASRAVAFREMPFHAIDISELAPLHDLVPSRRAEIVPCFTIPQNVSYPHRSPRRTSVYRRILP